jgi:hypothetical protein
LVFGAGEGDSVDKSLRQRGAAPAKVTLEMVAERAGMSPSTASQTRRLVPLP